MNLAKKNKHMKQQTKYILGVDPGTEPGICLLDMDGSIIFNKLVKKKDSMFNFEGVDEIFKGLPKGVVCYVEDVHSVFNSSAKANFNFGSSKGALMQAAFSNTKEFRLIQPKEWQKMVWEQKDITKKDSRKDTKQTSLNCAVRIMGNEWDPELFLPTVRSKKVNHNLIDSYLIALAGVRKVKGL